MNQLTYRLHKLPDKWYIIITPQNKEMVAAWYNRTGCDYSVGNTFGQIGAQSYGWMHRADRKEKWKGATELTVQEFERLVLHQKEESNIYIIY